MEPPDSDQGPRRYRIGDHAVSPGPPTARRPLRRALRLILHVGCWLYGAGVGSFWAAANWASPDSWVPHLLLYGPRWTVFVPALLLVPAAIRVRSRWSAVPLGIALASFLGIWGFNVPWRKLVPGDGPSSARLRVLTCNVQADDLRIQALADVIRETQPDIVLLQECRLDDPLVVLGRDGWYVRKADEFCVASRYPIVGFETLTRPNSLGRIVAVRMNVSWSVLTLPIVSVHLMTPRSGLEAIIESGSEGIDAFRAIADIQRLESGLVRRWVEDSPGSVLLAGDFNLTAEHALFRRDWSSYADAFSRTGWGLGHTMFTRRIGLRIDHILCGDDWRPTRCWVVGTDVGSAHRAVIADLAVRIP